MRFKLHFVPNQNPVLAFCNAAGNIFFWDFERLTAYRELMESLRDPERKDKGKLPRLPGWLKPVIPRQRADAANRVRGSATDKDSPSSNRTSFIESSKPNEELADYSPETLESWSSRYNMEDPHEPLRAHKTESSSANFVGRQAAWSPGGEWCVVVGSSNTTLVLQRWSKKGPVNGVRAN
jgi:polycomb protein EED